MKVLIVGDRGYIGSVLVPLLAKHHDVAGYDIDEDIRDVDSFRGACNGKDVVIYLASVSNNDYCIAHPDEAQRINQDCFPPLVEAAKDVSHFIYASSVAAYGSGENLTENYLLIPTTIYGEGKKFCEDYLKTQRVPYTIVRAATVCGWSPHMRWDTTVNKMVQDGMRGEITVNGGEQKRCHVHINDLCEFYSMILDKAENETYNVVWMNQQLNHTAYTVAAMTHAKVITKERTDNRSYTVSGEKAERLLGWKPIRSIANAVQDILNHV